MPDLDRTMADLREKVDRQPKLDNLVARCVALLDQTRYGMASLQPAIHELLGDMNRHRSVVLAHGNVPITAERPDWAAEKTLVEAVEEAERSGKFAFLSSEFTSIKARIREKTEEEHAEQQAKIRPPLLDYFTSRVESQEALVAEWQANGTRDPSMTLEEFTEGLADMRTRIDTFDPVGKD